MCVAKRAKQQIRMKPTNEQIQARAERRAVTPHTPAMESEIKAQSRNPNWAGAQAPVPRLRPYVHRISWIMSQSQHFCEKAPGHARKRRRRKWRLTRSLCFFHQPFHRSARSHHYWMYPHLATGDPRRRIRTQKRDKHSTQLRRRVWR